MQNLKNVFNILSFLEEISNEKIYYPNMINFTYKLVNHIKEHLHFTFSPLNELLIFMKFNE
ncbi:hypothetical protein [Wukongibacter baidiensis]